MGNTISDDQILNPVQKIGNRFLRFVHMEASGGIVLLGATVIAIVWANSPWGTAYHHLFETRVSLSIGGLYTLEKPLEVLINDALMAIFFFVVGLEIKQQFVVGELRKPAAAVLPAVAALGGMIVPALIYMAFNVGSPGAVGWGIPMATDIAFTLGVVSLLGNRVPYTLKVFLLSLAIVDDIGAIAVIALFYTDDLSGGWLLAAAGVLVVLALMRAFRVWYTPAYLVVGCAFWLAVLESGVHATIAGVILGVLAPARPLLRGSKMEDPVIDEIASSEISAPVMRRASFVVRERVSVAERLQELLHPWTSFIVVPIFALANSGVSLSAESLSAASSSAVTLGIIAGLVIGKLSGISLFTYLSVRSGLCELPQGVTWVKVIGISALAGIGFTVSMFIAQLGFDEVTILTDATIGILVASMIAAAVGVIILMFSQPSSEQASDSVESLS